jgi:transcriptional regulator with XRE-family HTH domain
MDQQPLTLQLKMSQYAGSSKKKKLIFLLRQLRTEAQLRQEDLARKLNQSQSFVSKYESGERRLDLLELQQICDAVGVPLQDFVKRFEGPTSESGQKISKSAQTFLGERQKR